MSPVVSCSSWPAIAFNRDDLPCPGGASTSVATACQRFQGTAHTRARWKVQSHVAKQLDFFFILHSVSARTMQILMSFMSSIQGSSEGSGGGCIPSYGRAVLKQATSWTAVVRHLTRTRPNLEHVGHSAGFFAHKN